MSIRRLKSFLSGCLAAISLVACTDAGDPVTITLPTYTAVAATAQPANTPSSTATLEATSSRPPTPAEVATAPLPAPAAWPIPDWQATSPEAQGLESDRLAGLLEFVREQELDLHSLLVARHGVLVLEVYYAPYDAETSHAIYSATKSVTGALVGLAIADGAIPGVDTPMLDFFPDRTIANVDERKQAITLEHLLTMSSGLGWRRPAEGGPPPVYAFQSSPDPVQFVLDRPVEEEPGSLFFYNSGGSHLLSAIVQTRTGLSTLAYGHQALFEPLGISQVDWVADPAGVNDGGTGLWLRPRDMARFGLLYLRRGEWAGRQLIPAGWVDLSTRSHMPAPTEEGQGYPPSPHLSGYGYQWWINAFGGYSAIGFGEQQLMVLPEQDLVIVITGTFPEQGEIMPPNLVQQFILPAVKTAPLPENEASAHRLAALVAEAAAGPQPTPVPPLPDIALQISGKRYQLQSPDGQITETLRLAFEPEAEVATFEGVLDGQPVEAIIGLDGVPRLTPGPAGQVLLQGSWQDGQTFVMESNLLGEAVRERATFTFAGDQVKAAYYSYVYGNVFELAGQQGLP